LSLVLVAITLISALVIFALLRNPAAEAGKSDDETFRADQSTAKMEA